MYVGSDDMTIYGLRQLVQWSLDHACMDTAERQLVRQNWEVYWEKWIHWIIEEYGFAQKASVE